MFWKTPMMLKGYSQQPCNLQPAGLTIRLLICWSHMLMQISSQGVLTWVMATPRPLAARPETLAMTTTTPLPLAAHLETLVRGL